MPVFERHVPDKKIVRRHMTQPVDLLNNAKRVFDNAKNKEILAANQETSPSIGEKLSRLLSISEQQNDENKENGGSNEAFFPQGQASNIANDGEINILDLLTNARNKEKTPAKPSNHFEKNCEKLLRFIEQRNDENKENDRSNAAFLAQVSQASNTIAGNEVYICLGLV